MRNIRSYILLGIALPFTLAPVYASLSANETDELIRKFAPQVLLHPAENYLPSSIDWYVGKSELRKRLPDGSDELTLQSPTLADLAQHTDPTYYLTAKGTPEEVKITNGGEAIIHGKSTAPCYAHLIEKPTGALIQYMFFYPYNGGFLEILDYFNIATHPGDWEHIDVHLEKSLSKSEVKDYRIKEVFYAIHGGTYYGVYRDANKIAYAEETHPIVYSAYHGHPSYPEDGFHILFDNTSKYGPKWETWNNVVNIGSIEAPTPGSEWIQFKGRWGDGGPDSPSNADWWRNQADERMTLFSEPFVKTRSNPTEEVWKTQSFKLSGRTRTRYKKHLWRIEGVKEGSITFSIRSKRSFFKFWNKPSVLGPYPGTGVVIPEFDINQTVDVRISKKPDATLRDLTLIVEGVGE